MKQFNYHIGTILNLEGTRHVGVVINKYKTAELIACSDERYGQICKLAIIDLQVQKLHPVTNKPFSYIKEAWECCFNEKELLLRIKEIGQKYHNTPYNKITNNCQHFAYEVATGKRKSPDADPLKWFGKFHKQISALERFTNGSTSNSSSGTFSNFEGFSREINQLILQT